MLKKVVSKEISTRNSKVLFISKAKRGNNVSSILSEQASSLTKFGFDINFFLIKGKKFSGYLSNFILLRNEIKSKNYKLYHAHYSYSAIFATFCGARPLVVSLMGGDIKEAGFFLKLVLRFMSKFIWQHTIVKSTDSAKSLKSMQVSIIPNGVDIDKFKPIKRDTALKITGWHNNKKHLLFAANPFIKIKNFELVKEACKIINDDSIELHYLENIEFAKMRFYYNSADVVILVSIYEGSPNVIKEAMACSRPIVSTDVGDVRINLEGLEGCFITTYDPKDVAEKIQLAINFGKQTLGRQRISKLGLDLESTANRLVSIYTHTLNG